METENKSIVFDARQIMRRAQKAALATLDPAGSGPFVSLAAVATMVDGRPITLISTLARHTQNLKANPAVSLLFENPASSGGVMAGSRVTVCGTMRLCDDANARRRYLARHEDAKDFVDFADFSFYALDMEEAHFIAAFGRIHTFAGNRLLLNGPVDDALKDGEASVIDHMNSDHRDMVQLIATKHAHTPRADWRMTDIDREGFSLNSEHGTLRIIFPEPLISFADLRKNLAEVANETRNF